jgi:hypothetical protein
MPLKTYRITISLKEPFKYGIFVGTMTTMSPVENMPGYEHVMALYDTQTAASQENILSVSTWRNPDNLLLLDTTIAHPQFTKCGINITQFNQISGVWNISNEGESYTLYKYGDRDHIKQQLTIKITFMTDQFCFNTGTKILCLNRQGVEEEIPIETLRKGDLVKTHLHGYRPVVRIGKGVMFNNPRDVWNCMYEYPHSNYLTLTGGHAILCDTITVEERVRLTQLYRGGKLAMLDGKYVVFANTSSLFRPVQNDSIYVYYHLALEGDEEIHRRFGIWANGVMAETSTVEHFTNQNYVAV